MRWGAISAARATARERVWNQAGAPTQDGQVVIDLDATLLTAHSEKKDATSTWKKTFGHHPLLGFADHGAGGAGEPVAELLRPGRAGSNTAADHVTVFDTALAQIPQKLRTPDEAGRIPVLVRTDAAGATHQFAKHLAVTGVGFCLGANLGHVEVHTAVAQLPAAAWTPAYQATKPRAGQQGPRIEPRDGAWVAELTGLVDLSAWPAGTRLILRKERPHPGAQLRITDHDGMRVTGLLTNTTSGQLADLELRHRRDARVEDRIRGRQRHRACQPALPRHGAEPDLAGHRRTGRGPARLDRPARPASLSRQLRTQTAAAADPGRGRADRAHRPPPHPPHRPSLALGRGDHHRPRPADVPTRPLTTNPPPHRPRTRSTGRPR